MNGILSRPRSRRWLLSLVATIGLWTLAGCGDPSRGTVEIGVDRDAVNQQILNPGTTGDAAAGATSKEPEKIASPGGKSIIP